MSDHQTESVSTVAERMLTLLAEYRQTETALRRAEMRVERAIYREGDNNLEAAQDERDAADRAAVIAHDALQAAILDLRYRPGVLQQ